MSYKKIRAKKSCRVKVKCKSQDNSVQFSSTTRLQILLHHRHLILSLELQVGTATRVLRHNSAAVSCSSVTARLGGVGIFNLFCDINTVLCQSKLTVIQFKLPCMHTSCYFV